MERNKQSRQKTEPASTGQPEARARPTQKERVIGLNMDNIEPMMARKTRQNPRRGSSFAKKKRLAGLYGAAHGLGLALRAFPARNRMLLSDLRYHWDQIIPPHLIGAIWPRCIVSRRGEKGEGEKSGPPPQKGRYKNPSFSGNGILHLEVLGPIATLIRHEEPALIAAINRHIGHHRIRGCRYYRVYSFSEKPS